MRQKNIPLLHKAVHQALKEVKYSWEMILVDDGSQDKSPEALEKLASKDPKFVKVILLRRNFGQTTAIAAGIDHASGDIVVMMDADLQNDPADIPNLVSKIDEGYDVVSGWRYERKDTFLLRVLPSRIANGFDFLDNWSAFARLWLHLESLPAQYFVGFPFVW